MSHSITIDDKLYNEIKDYCNLNNLKVSTLCSDLLKKALNELKYGDIPFGLIPHLKEGPLTADYIVPINDPMEPPTGESLAACMEEIISVTPVTKDEEEPKKEEVKTKTKRTRILK